jgi:hypothetical protein
VTGALGGAWVGHMMPGFSEKEKKETLPLLQIKSSHTIMQVFSMTTSTSNHKGD